MFEKSLRYLAVVSLLIIILGMIKQSLFYYRYDIIIGQYMKLSEIPNLISFDLLLLIPGLLIGNSLSYVTASSQRKQLDMKIENETNEFRKSTLVKKREKYTKLAKLYTKILVLLSVLVFLIGILKAFSYAAVLMCIALNFLAFGAYAIVVLNNKFPDLFKSEGEYFFSIIVVCVACSLTYSTGVQIKSIDNNQNKGTIISRKDGTSHISDDTSYYIGRTENYVFIYNRTQKAATILPSDEIKEIYLKVR